MSVYRVTPRSRIYRVDVGWDRDARSYWMAVYDQSGSDPDARRSDGLVRTAGGDGELPTIHDLLERTWGWVDWDAEESNLRRLIADPPDDERAWHELQRRQRATSSNYRIAEINALLARLAVGGTGG
jgi:hypothetical protein